MTDPTTLTITDEQHAIARAYVIANIEELLYWSDLAELLAEPFLCPERDHPAERAVHQLAKIEGIPLQRTLRLDAADLQSLNLATLAPGDGAAQILALLSRSRLSG
ncbi:hypothetical protein [Microbacterium sp. Be9]|uniref:hypothetical protein n=1 Tax=Microbacterium sp. Be9 TaxID=2720211 RepID=UPI001422278C|nr:hypothetical protein [Microbacterium sp. Be9]NIG66711.1 hypothetical protein [Microbacterium sp. Be9]